LKLKGTHQLLVYVDDVNILDESVHNTKENTEYSVIASMESGLEINTDKTMYLVISQDQHAGQSHNIETDNNSVERVEEF
jgi:hypothetical protein